MPVHLMLVGKPNRMSHFGDVGNSTPEHFPGPQHPLVEDVGHGRHAQSGPEHLPEITGTQPCQSGERQQREFLGQMGINIGTDVRQDRTWE